MADDVQRSGFVLPDDEKLLDVVGSEALVLQNKRGALAAEATNRSSLFVAIFSGTLVAAGFTATTPYARSFLFVAPPILLVLGLVTFVRLVAIARDDRRYDLQLEHIRAGFATVSPRGPAFFPPERRAGEAGAWSTRLLPLTSAAGLIALLNGAIVGTGLALLLSVLTGQVAVWPVVIGITSTVLSAVLQLAYAARGTSTGWRGPAGTPPPPA